LQRLARLRELRELAGLSQEGFSEASGVSRATIADLEAGKRPPRPSTARKLAESLGVDIRDLLEEPTSPKEQAPTSPVPPKDEEAVEEERRARTFRQRFHSDEELVAYLQLVLDALGNRIEELRELANAAQEGRLHIHRASGWLSMFVYDHLQPNVGTSDVVTYMDAVLQEEVEAPDWVQKELVEFGKSIDAKLREAESVVEHTRRLERARFDNELEQLLESPAKNT
jgi:transcriptional regulator with XRE-family HTH domain